MHIVYEYIKSYSYTICIVLYVIKKKKNTPALAYILSNMMQHIGY
jgi:cyanate permease